MIFEPDLSALKELGLKQYGVIAHRAAWWKSFASVSVYIIIGTVALMLKSIWLYVGAIQTIKPDGGWTYISCSA